MSGQTHPVPSGRTRVGAACWLLTIIWFVLQPVVGSAWTRPYSYVHDAVSDLGAVGCGPVAGQAGAPAREVCSPWHLAWDATFVLCGVLIVIGTLMLRASWPRRASVTAGSVLLVVSGVGLVVVGLVPEDVSLLVHSAAAVVQIPAQGVALLLLGIGFVRGHARFRALTLVCAVIALAGTVSFFSPLSSVLGYGLAERLALAPFMAWSVITGLLLLITPRAANP